eukprot:7815330-Pyramimonas_sp.AAC.1
MTAPLNMMNTTAKDVEKAIVPLRVAKVKDVHDVDQSFIAHPTALLTDQELPAPRTKVKVKVRVLLLPRAKAKARDVARVGKARVERASPDQKVVSTAMMAN